MGVRHLLTVFLWIMGLVGALLLSGEPLQQRADRVAVAIDEVRALQFAEVRLDGALREAQHSIGASYDELTRQALTITAAVNGGRDAIAAIRGGEPTSMDAEADRTPLSHNMGDVASDPQVGETPSSLFDTIAETVEGKRKQVEGFKSEHAILQNSVTYVPTLIGEILPEAEQEPPERAARLDGLLRGLWQDTLIFGLRGGEARGRSIEARATELGQVEGLQPSLAEKIGGLRRHLEVLVSSRREVDRRLEAYFGATEGETYAQLQGQLSELRKNAVKDAQLRDNLRLVLIGLLILLAVQGLWGMRRRALRLEEGLEARTLALEAANAELEAEVEARRRTENELAEALKKSRAATQAKADFLANMSHEIRTPMNGVVGMTTLLLDTRLDDEQMQYVSSIERSGTALLTVINDILDFSKIEAGRMDIESRPFDVHQVVQDVAGVLLPAAQGKEIRIESRVDERVPQWVLGDAVRLRQILLNLAGNAVKFTREGKVAVEVIWRGEDMLEFVVADTGIGIPAEKLRYIFDAFSQADSSTTRKFGGTGLGLAICRRLAELMRGEIRVESQVGRGSRFRVSLPMGAADAPVEAKTDDDKANDRLIEPVTDQIRVLLAEDNVINQRVATRLLEKLGCDVHSVDDGTGAVEQALGKDYDIIFMDCQMPRMDGYAATRTLRAQGYEKPIVAMTANAMPGDRERCLEAGMDDYIPKPIPRGVLERVLRTWAPVSGEGASDEARPPEPPATASRPGA